MPLFRIVLSALLAVAATILTATPALAHAVLESSTPANGASLDTAPDTVTLTFGEAVSLPQNPLSVTGPGGAAWTIGAVTTSGASVTAPVQANGPAGQYTLRYTVVSDDGDTVKGSVTFTMTASASAASAAAPASAATDATADATAGAAAGATEAATPVGTATAAPVAGAGGSDSEPSAAPWIAVAIVVLGLVGAAAVTVRRRRSGTGRRTP